MSFLLLWTVSRRHGVMFHIWATGGKLLMLLVCLLIKYIVKGRRLKWNAAAIVDDYAMVWNMVLTPAEQRAVSYCWWWYLIKRKGKKSMSFLLTALGSPTFCKTDLRSELFEYHCSRLTFSQGVTWCRQAQPNWGEGLLFVCTNHWTTTLYLTQMLCLQTYKNKLTQFEKTTKEPILVSQKIT